MAEYNMLDYVKVIRDVDLYSGLTGRVFEVLRKGNGVGVVYRVRFNNAEDWYEADDLLLVEAAPAQATPTATTDTGDVSARLVKTYHDLMRAKDEYHDPNRPRNDEYAMQLRVRIKSLTDILVDTVREVVEAQEDGAE